MDRSASRMKSVFQRIKELNNHAQTQLVNHEHQNPTALVDLLMFCAKGKDLLTGSKLHADIQKMGLLKKNTFLGNNVVNMYVKCGALSNAQQAFEEISFRNVVSFNTLIAGYAQNGYAVEAISCLERMRREGLHPNAKTFASALKACGSIRDYKLGEKIHAEIVRDGLLKTNSILGTALVDMYVKCGLFTKAEQVFDANLVRDVVSWTTIITGYAQHGHCWKAIKHFVKMQKDGISPNAVTYASVLKACGNIGAVGRGEEIHAEIVRKGLLEMDRVLASALVDMYSKCGALSKSQEIFDLLPNRDAKSWNVLISGYVHYNCFKEAILCYDNMRCEGIAPDEVSLACTLKASASLGAIEKGKTIHDDILRCGLFGKYGIVDNALIDMYAKCGATVKAREVLYELPIRDVISWNALITGYAKYGCCEKACDCFQQMRYEGLSPDAVTYSSVLKSCASTGTIQKGKQIHVEIIGKDYLQKDIMLGTVMVEMYAKCGALATAQDVFDHLPLHDVVSWTTLIAGYVQYEHGEEALKCLDLMQREGLVPDSTMYACALNACGSIGAITRGEKLHSEIFEKGLLGEDSALDTALVDMYAKCGAIEAAQLVFDKLHVNNDISCWNALMAGYALMGCDTTVFKLYHKLVEEGIRPDLVTLTIMLHVCGSSGSIDKGQDYFETLSSNYGITPTLEHYTCMVGLFGVTGQFDRMMSAIKKMPSSEHLPVWFALLDACQKWGNINLATLAFEHAVQLDKNCGVPYVYMNNIYKAAGLLMDTDKT